MRTIILGILFLLLTSCGGGGSDETGQGYFHNQIVDWQQRERACLSYVPEYKAGSEVDMNIVQEKHEWVYDRLIHHVRDKRDYWQTSCETLRWSQGDCEDKAFLLYRFLREEGTPDNLLGIIIYQAPGSGVHASLYVMKQGQMLIVDEMETAGNLNARIYAVFNLFSNANIGGKELIMPPEEKGEKMSAIKDYLKRKEEESIIRKKEGEEREEREAQSIKIAKMILTKRGATSFDSNGYWYKFHLDGTHYTLVDQNNRVVIEKYRLPETEEEEEFIRHHHEAFYDDERIAKLFSYKMFVIDKPLRAVLSNLSWIEEDKEK